MREYLSHATRNKYRNAVKTEKKQQQHEKNNKNQSTPMDCIFVPLRGQTVHQLGAHFFCLHVPDFQRKVFKTW